MTPEQQRAISDLLTQERVLSVAVLAEGEPVAGSLPYALSREPTGFLVHVSALARHNRGLGEGAPVSILIRRADIADGDPQQIERVTLQGTARVVACGSEDYEAGKRRYLERFPGAAVTFGLGDFRLVRIEPRSGRYVGGFATALNLNERNLAELEL